MPPGKLDAERVTDERARAVAAVREERDLDPAFGAPSRWRNTRDAGASLSEGSSSETSTPRSTVTPSSARRAASSFSCSSCG